MDHWIELIHWLSEQTVLDFCFRRPFHLNRPSPCVRSSLLLVYKGMQSKVRIRVNPGEPLCYYYCIIFTLAQVLRLGYDRKRRKRAPPIYRCCSQRWESETSETQAMLFYSNKIFMYKRLRHADIAEWDAASASDDRKRRKGWRIVRAWMNEKKIKKWLHLEAGTRRSRWSSPEHWS